MVFESLVVDLINKYLGEYVVKLDKSQLKLGLLGGNATLENLDIKENALDSFDLPVRVVQGHIGKITLKIPWKHLYSEPVIAELDGLYVLIVPNIAMKYNPERERIYKLEAKQRELNRIEEAKAKINETKKESDSKDTFGEKLAAQIVKNLQIKINNIHIRYEDASTSPNHPFSIGITLANLSFQTCDSNGECIIIKDDTTREFFKSVKMDSLAVYWMSNPPLFHNMNRGLLRNSMKGTIASSDYKIQNISYLIHPISCDAMMHVHMRPEMTNFTVPQLTLNMTMDQLSFGFTREQYCDLINFLDSCDRVWTQSRFIRFRPAVPLAPDSYKLWWQFPYQVILEEQVRRRRQMWSWTHIRRHRNLCRQYSSLWEIKLLEQKMLSADLDVINKCEEELDLLNITLCRQQAEMKVKKLKKKNQAQKSSSGGWFTGWFGSKAEHSSNDSSSSQNTESLSTGTVELQNRMRNEFTQEEKAKLYQAIGYSDGATAGSTDVPMDYVNIKLDVILHKMTFSLVDTSLHDKKLMKLVINSVSARVQQRSAAKATKLGLTMNSMLVTGSVHDDGSIPTVVSTQRLSQQENLLMVNFETNPLDESGDQKLCVKAEPLEIIYDASTINRIVKFFTPPEDLRLYEISTQVMASIEEVKEMTATGLRHLAEQRMYTEIIMDIKPSYFILPEEGVFTKNCRMLLVDLGSIHVASERTTLPSEASEHLKQQDGRLNYDIIKETAYDKFHIDLSTIQLLLIDRGDDWRKLRNQPSSPNHILRPFGFNFQLKKCLISNDANLPKIFIEGKLPFLSVSISNKALHNILQLVLHIPFPQTEETKIAPKSDEILKISSGDHNNFLLAPVAEMNTSKILRTVLPSGDTISSSSDDGDTGIDEDEDEEEEEFFDTTDGSIDIDASTVRRRKRSVSTTSGAKLKEKARKQNIVDLDSVFKISQLEVEIHEEDEEVNSSSEGDHKRDGTSTKTAAVTTITNTTTATNTTQNAAVSGAKTAHLGLSRKKPILNICVVDIGTSVTLRRYDMFVNAHVGDLSVMVPAIDVCLVQTKRKSKINQRLLQIKLVIAEKTAPDFTTTYKSTRHQLSCEFKSLDVCMHQEALVILINFCQDLLPGLTDSPSNEPSSPNQQIPWASRVGDREGMVAIAKRQADQSVNKFQDTSVLGLVTEKIDNTRDKRIARMSAEREAQKQEISQGKRLIIPESSMIQWNVCIEMERVRVLLSNQLHGNIIEVSMHGMKTNVAINYHTTEVAVNIDDMRIQDPKPGVLYKKIIWIDPGDSVFTMQMVLFNEMPSNPSYEDNLELVDISLKLDIGKMKVTFLYQFISRISTFINSFQTSMAVLQTRAAEQAKQQMTEALEQVPASTRMKLQMNVDAPVFYVPENSKSTDALMLDLGSLKLNNKLLWTPDDREAILDQMTVQLSNLRLSRAILLETSVKDEKGILHPINIDIELLRNLNYPSYNKCPALDVKGTMQSINVGMNNIDYSTMVSLLHSNLAEADVVPAEEVHKPSNLASSASGGATAKLANTGTTPPGHAGQHLSPTGKGKSYIDSSATDSNSLTMDSSDEVINIRFQFSLKGIEVNLFCKDDATMDFQTTNDKSLSRMNAQEIIVAGCIYHNEAMSCSVRLTDIGLRDMQAQSSDNHINRLIRCNESEGHKDFILIEFLKDKSGDGKLNVDIAGLYICLYMDFLMKLTEFFVEAQPPAPPPPKKKMLAVRGHEENPRKYRKRPQKVLEPTRDSNFEITVNMRRPEIMIVENIEDINSNAVLMEFEVQMSMALLKECDIINATINKLQAQFCPFLKTNRPKHTLDIIAPTTVSLYCKRPLNDGMQGTLTVDQLAINITPQVIQSFSIMLNSLQFSRGPSNNTAEGSTMVGGAASGAASGASISAKDGRSVAPATTATDNSLHAAGINIDEDGMFWEMTKFTEEDFPFITKGLQDKQTMNETNKDEEVECGFDVAQMINDVEQRRADQIYVRMPIVRIVLESEVAKKCVPMFILESSIDGYIKNPSTMVSVGMTISLSVNYFNDHINEWEPLLETYPEDNNRMFTFELEYITSDDSALFAEEDHDDLASIEQSRVTTLLISRDNLELTLSRTALDVLSKLGQAFQQAYALNFDQHRSIAGAPYMFVNQCGLDLRLQLTANSNPLLLVHGQELADNHIDIKKAAQRHIRISAEEDAWMDLIVCKTETKALAFRKCTGTGVSDNDLHTVLADIDAYLGMKTVLLRSVLKVHNATYDVLNIYYRRKQQPQSSQSRQSIDQQMVLLSRIDPESTYNVPIPPLIESTGELFIQAHDLKTRISQSGIFWKVPRDKELADTQIIECASENITYYYAIRLKTIPVEYIPGKLVTFNKIATNSMTVSANVLAPTTMTTPPNKHKKHKGESDSGNSSHNSPLSHSSQLQDATTTSLVTSTLQHMGTGAVLHSTSEPSLGPARTFLCEIRTPLMLHNQLPIPINYQSQMYSSKVEQGTIKSLRSACLERESLLKLGYTYQAKEWYGQLQLNKRLDELSLVMFKAREGFTELVMNLGVHFTYKEGTASISIYSPYWMINKTGMTLAYKSGDNYIVEHAATNTDAVLFSLLSKSIFSKKKVYLRVNDSNWSDKFSLDTVGSSGKIIAKKKPQSYEVAVKISLSSSGLTKMVTFLPYYIIINQSNLKILCTEMNDQTDWITVPPNEAVPFWPISDVAKSMLMRCKIDDERDIIITEPFPFYESHSILMKLNKKYIGLFVEVQITEEANLITLQLYQEGMALVQIINHLGDDVAICFKQQGTAQETTLNSMNCMMYAWQDARQKREMVWRVESDRKVTHTNSLIQDGIEDFYVNDMKAYWISFVWDMHRILLFTNDIYVAKNARLSTELETIDLEVVISLQSIGLSLVDNEKKQELSYISITSSGVIWNQVRRNKRHKPLKLNQSEELEEAYDSYINKVRIGDELGAEQQVVVLDNNQIEVDISKKLMLRPEKCELTRTFEPGVYLQYRTSPHQMHLHLRVYRIQVDNQMFDHHFPVVFAPYPPPRSVAMDTGLKPLIELSAVIGKSSVDIDSMRFKYFRVLIQEMQVMLDQGYINALLDFFANTVPDFNEEEQFKLDQAMIDNKLLDMPSIKAILQGGKKCVFDNFHISPIKLHLSFSLSKTNQSDCKTALHSDMLNLFLQSVGIAITDMQNVIFKLGYFEKQNSIMPMNQMMETMMRHYVGQGLRQMYVLVLGLDVLGNPFGVIRGMAQGVEDLFYEPVRGAVLGPEEFVDGVAYGVKSLFGHAVGGAAGAVSRIVGSVGKGIAALTMDPDYQQKRREQLARKPENLGVGLAQGGKGLVMGVFSGVTGVITKPVEGARKGGVEGFFKGMGQGLVGVVTRPVSGVVDFASSGFEGIRRVADTTSVEVRRIRPPRFIPQDGIVACYELRKAEGNTIWRKLEQATTDEFYEYHIYCKNKRDVLFLTNMRIMLLDKNELMGTWSLSWHLTYDKLSSVPTISCPGRGGTGGGGMAGAVSGAATGLSDIHRPVHIVFTLKEKQRRIFSKDNITKEVSAELLPAKNVILRIMNIMKRHSLLSLDQQQIIIE